MRTLKKNSFLTILLAVLPVSLVLSQSSPFAGYGIGEINNDAFGRNNAMGGTGIAIRTNLYLNNQNPASYSAIDTLSFFFEAGMKGKFQTLKGNNGETKHSKIDVDYFAFGFPITKYLVTSIGMRPATNTEYTFFGINQATVSGSDAQQTFDIRYVGEGTISNLYGGLGVKVTNNLSVGAHIHYLFGDIKNYYVQSFTTGDFLYGAKTERRINDMMLDFGAQYSFFVNNLKNNRMTIGAVFNPKINVSGKSTHIFGQGSNFIEDGFLDIVDSMKISSTDKFTQMPMGVGVGISYTIRNRLVLAADFSTKFWSKTDLTATEMFDSQNITIADATCYSFGLEWTPNQQTGIRYYERIRYRLGFRYGNDYIKIGDKQVTDRGITAGFGFPLRRTSTSLNFSIDYGTKGISDKNLTEEQYMKFTLGFTLHEYWFFKSKIR
ncbi:MAG: hypothetical protein FWH18_00430 [Marinilabiliaceae bacterium]|nr:hypothetical protein [Marinilabiliaceae bacterium]